MWVRSPATLPVSSRSSPIAPPSTSAAPSRPANSSSDGIRSPFRERDINPFCPLQESPYGHHGTRSNATTARHPKVPPGESPIWLRSGSDPPPLAAHGHAQPAESQRQ